MDFFTLLHIPAMLVTMGVAATLLGAGVVLEHLVGRKAAWRRLRQGWMPLALMAGFIGGYLVMHELPRARDERPWYLDEAWKSAVIAAGLIGACLPTARMLPRLLEIPAVVLTALALVLCTVRGPWIAPDPWLWREWSTMAILLAGGLTLYLVAAIPVWRDERFWLLGILVMWLSCSAAGITVMFVFEQRLGRFLVMGAVLAGAAGVVGILPSMRAVATGAAPVLAMLFASLVMLVAFYSHRLEEQPLAPGATAMLACGPLGMAIAWIPLAHKRPWLGTILAGGVTLAMVLLGAALGIANQPLPLPPYEY